jgi:hypothetical protein
MATFYRTRHSLTLPGVSTPPLLTYYWDSTGGTPAAVVTEALARVRAFWNSLAARVPVNAGLVHNLIADEIEETTGAIVAQQAGTAPAAVTFSGSANLLPLQTQGLVRFQTSIFIAGRRLQGRQNIPYRSVSDSDSGGAPVTAYFAAMNTALPLLGTTIVTPISQRIWSRPKPGRAGLSAPVTARSNVSTFAVLRSRRT